MSYIDPVTIRLARQSEWALLWPLVQDAADVPKQCTPEAFRARFQAVLADAQHRLWVAEVPGEVVGYAWVQALGLDLRSGVQQALFHDLYLNPAWRHKGLGRQLFAAVCAWARAQEIARLSWHANPAAIDFYQRLDLAPAAGPYYILQPVPESLGREKPV